MRKIKVYCGAPDCDAVFGSLEEENEHWRDNHLKEYGWSAFGVHSKIVVSGET